MPENVYRLFVVGVLLMILSTNLNPVGGFTAWVLGSGLAICGCITWLEERRAKQRHTEVA